jgi:hypothetical protein
MTMAATTRGYPYPVGTDRVMDGDNAIQALAQAVNDKAGGPTVTGEVTMTTLANGASGNVAVTFPAGRFSGTPHVFCQTGNGRVNVSPANTTAAGFTYSMANFSGGATSGTQTGYWLATLPIS